MSDEVKGAPVVPAFLREEARRRTLLFNGRIADAAARHGLHLADIHGKSALVIPTHPEFLSPDGFHPSDEGYEFWAFELWPVVKRTAGRTEAQAKGEGGRQKAKKGVNRQPSTVTRRRQFFTGHG